MKNKIFNKILPNKQFKHHKKDFELINTKNEELKKENELLIEKNNQLINENERLKKLSSFINFQEFLANSYVSPIINAPFSAEDKRVFAFMDHLSKYLIRNVRQIKDKPLVSIIMPTCNNRKSIIQKTMRSVLEQTYENWELIIIDDGINEDNLNLLDNINNNKIKILYSNENKGLSFAYNVGLDNAIGEYIFYLHPPEEWDSRYLETMIGAFIELPNADALYSGFFLYDDYNSKPSAAFFGSYNKPLLHNRNFININCFSHKTKIYKEIGGFNEHLAKLESWEYILRISNKFKMYSVPVLLSKYYNLTPVNEITDRSIDYYEDMSKIINQNIIPLKPYKHLSHKVTIIIPSYESLNELKKCIESILSLTFKDKVDIIIVDNNSCTEIREYLRELESKQIKIILNDINYGFTYAVKQGIDASDKCSDILLLNNDAILMEGALEHLQNGAYMYKDCGLIVPHEIVFEKNRHMNYHVPYAEPKFKCDVTPSRIHHNIINMPLFHDGELLELEFAPFFCVYIKREIYNKTLGLDPELGRHYRSDRIFSDFIRHVLKLKIYQEPNSYVYHKHQTSTNILRKNKNEFDIMFNKNQWPPDLAKRLGFKMSLWD